MDFFTTTNGVAIRACDTGKGKTIVLLHGYLETMEIWENTITELSKTFRIIALDLPGHGFSGFREGATTMEFMADCIKSLLDKLEISECCIIGHSMGGYVALAFAKKYPETAKALCLFCSTPNADTEQKKKDRDREIELIRAGKMELIIKNNISRGFANMNLSKLDEEIFAIEEIASISDTNGIIACLQAMKIREDMNGFMKTIQNKTLFVFGKYDNYITFDVAENIMQKYPQATTAILENSGHNGFIEEPEKAMKAISDFAEKHSVKLLI
ncbi:MAG: alpha/beta fold hydrolase [Prevotellaceae bacterium]|jgi:pimeloyl-ACP methyl ester carboxylesterase|nr:alpha/beta fold hydrolase [Prevotellaceae bacterium]